MLYAIYRQIATRVMNIFDHGEILTEHSTSKYSSSSLSPNQLPVLGNQWTTYRRRPDREPGRGFRLAHREQDYY